MTTPASTLIYTHGGGRLGNQVLRFAHWMAWVLEHRGAVEVRDVAFWPYAKYFAIWQAHPGCVFPPRPDRWDELARWRQLLPEWVLHRLDWRVQRMVQSGRWWDSASRTMTLDEQAGEALDLEGSDFWNAVSRQQKTYCSGWRITGWNLLAKHQSVVRDYLRPTRVRDEQAQAFIGRLRQKHGFIIGVMIRHEDYKVWLDGRYYFPVSRYVEWIRQALDLHAAERPAAVVAAAEWPGPAVFGSLPVYSSTGNPGGGNPWFAQWAELAHCDLVLSVPSTFAATAAFRGDLPLWPILHHGQILAKEQVIRDGMLGAARHPDFSIAVN